VLYGVVLGFMLLGAYSLENSIFNVGVMLAFGLVGYLLRKIDVPLAPMALTIVLGQLMERSFRQSLAMSEGSVTVFFSTPLAAVLLIIAMLALLYSGLRPALARKTRFARILAPESEVPDPATTSPVHTSATTDGNNK
jgi:putative tricarboxylic transport membrane protein